MVSSFAKLVMTSVAGILLFKVVTHYYEKSGAPIWVIGIIAVILLLIVTGKLKIPLKFK